MEFYRLTQEPFHTDISGRGANQTGGRWNRKGVSVLYTSEHISLSLLEVFVQSINQKIPTDLKLVFISVPNDSTIAEITPQSLPFNWRTNPAPGSLTEMGTKWLLSARSLLLRVPSVVVPTEYNVLINPAHPAFEEVDIKSIRDFTLDPG